MKSLKKSILDTIKHEKIIPLPRWKFVLFHILLWCIVLSTILIGSLGGSLLYFIWYLPENISLRWMQERDIELELLFAMWILGILLSLLFASLVFQKTGQGYKITRTKVIIFFILSSCIGGGILHLSHISDYSDRGLQHIQPYKKFREKSIQKMVNTILDDPQIHKHGE